MKRFIPRTPAVFVATLCLCNRSRAFSKLRATGAARRVLGILATAILAIALSARPASAVVSFSNVADTTITAPGHGAFTSFGSPWVSGSNVAFFGSYSGGQGIYTGSVGATGAAKVVETGDTAPGHGAFTGFNGLPSVSGSNVAFFGNYSGGFGLYLESGGSLSAVLNTGDALFGSTVSSLNNGRFGYDNNAIAFQYTLADGRSGIAVATVASVPEPSSGVLGVIACGLMWCWRKRFK